MASMATTFCIFFFFFFFAAIFSVFSLFLYILRIKLWCNCDTCRSYLSGTWVDEFLNLSDWYSHLLRHSPTGTIHVHVLGNIITANPDNVEHVLKTKFDNYPKGKRFSVILGDLLGRGIFNVDGDEWLFQRNMASLELGSFSVRASANEIVAGEIKTRLIPLLSSVSDRKDRILDLQDVFRRFSFDNICKVSFGFDPGCLELSLPISDFAAAFDLATKLTAERGAAISPIIWKLKRFLKLGSEKKLEEAIKKVNILATEMINQRRKNLGVVEKQDLLSRFMASIDDDKYLRDIVISFILAGRDTVAAALTSFFWLLSRNPAVEYEIREEMNRVMGQNMELDSFEAMKDMHYVHAALYESMRLFPPVQFDSKFAGEDDIFPDGTFIRKGTRVTYHPYAMGRMERIWGPDCLDFKPERWLKTGLFSPQNPFQYPVFQAGPRFCPGKEMAVMGMKSVVVALVKRFDIRVVGSDKAPRFSPGLTANLSGGLPVQIHGRS